VVGADTKRKSTNMKKINKITLALLLIFSSLIGNNYLYSKNSNELYEKIDLFSEVLDTIKKNYVDEVDQSVVMDSAINGVLQSLDPYSAYMSPKSFEGMQTETKGEFGGLGIEIGMESGVVKVITPINDTPASDAGIKSGDYIVKINEEQVQGKSLSEAVELMRGPVGSKINLTVRRKNVKKALNFTIKRAVIEVKSVEAKIVGEEKKIGYLRLKSFNENSYNQLSSSINKFEKKNKLKGYILDLRNNPGGLLTQAINITDFFLNDGEIVSTKGRKVSETRRFFSKKGDGINGKPLILITNNGSASASEIVAGALKDHKRAIILGENTYGKGSVQSIIPLKNGGGIRLTISKYYLPSGKSISEIGVLPDIFVEEIEDNFKINSKTDNQLAYAINLLKS
jgi:carboxyl-terminal processing protease